MNVTDTHCDTLCKLTDFGCTFENASLHVSLKKLPKNIHYTQFFACFTDPAFYDNPKKRCMQLINTFHKSVVSSPKVHFCRNFSDLESGRKHGKMCAFLSLEGGEPIEKTDDLDTLYKLGVRMIAPVWNNDNKIASGALGKQAFGLTDFGVKIINRMNELGIICDVSHMSEKAFFEAVKNTSLPPVASHSCSKRLCPHPRNLTDEQFFEIKKKNGYIGIGFYPPFLTNEKKADIDSILEHMEHFLSLGGESTIGLGSDFDGIDCLPDGMSSVSDIDKLINAMLRRGWAECLVKKITGENIEKIIRFF